MLAKQRGERLKPPPLAHQAEGTLDLALQTLQGEQFDVMGLKGKTVFLHFWHPACTACLSEIPALNRLYAQFADGEVAFAAVSTGGLDETKAAVAEAGFSMPCFLKQGVLPEVYRTRSTPATFILNPAGEIAFRHLGSARWDDAGAVAYLRLVSQTEATAAP